MKTEKFTSAIVTLSLVLFMSVTSIANTGVLTSGDLTKSGNKNLAITNSSEMDFSFLRFDVAKFSSENEKIDMISNSLDFIRFDVDEFINENETESMELPLDSEYKYLRFDINNFTESNTGNLNELPADEFNYLRFDVNTFVSINNVAPVELPITE